MNIDNILLLTAGLIATLTFLVHTFYGGKEIARPLLSSEINKDVKYTMYASWHLVTVTLFTSAFLLVLAGLNYAVPRSLLLFISISWILFGIIFMWVSSFVARPGGLLRLPQWIFLVPVGILGLIATA